MRNRSTEVISFIDFPSCNAGYYGLDGTTCSPCLGCDPKATATASCLAGSTADTSACRCNAGYFGTGRVCSPCRPCHPNAAQTVSCPAGSVMDVSACTCNDGFYGDGRLCTPCAAELWLLGTCANATRPLINATLHEPAEGWCCTVTPPVYI
jgi:hypothetical protein